jgi:hypothetical protein
VAVIFGPCDIALTATAFLSSSSSGRLKSPWRTPLSRRYGFKGEVAVEMTLTVRPPYAMALEAMKEPLVCRSLFEQRLDPFGTVLEDGDLAVGSVLVDY